MFRAVGRYAATYPKTVCLAWVLIGGLLAWQAPHWDTRTQDDDVRFVPDRFTSVRAHFLLEQAFPQDVSECRVVFAIEREDELLRSADFQFVDQLVKDLEELRRDAPELKLGKIEYYKEGLAGGRLTSEDRRCTLVAMCLSTPYLAIATMNTVDRIDDVVQHRVKQARRTTAGLNVYTTGSAGIGRDLTKVAATSLEDTTIATIILVIGVLLLVYRAPLMALIPLATIAISVWVALDLLALMTALPGVHLVNITKIFAIVILYGAGTDYCLFLISRYREELEAGHNITDALSRSVGGVGEALAASAGTVMVGLGLMALAEFAKVRYAGPAIALSLGVALLASLTLTPALLRLIGPWAFWPGRQPGQVTTGKPAKTRRLPQLYLGFWDWISHKVVARPALIFTVSIVAILPLVVVGLGVESNYRATGELSPETKSLKGLAALQRHFTAGEIGPVTVLLSSETDWTEPRAQLELEQMSRTFRSLDNVAEVRSLTQPNGSPILEFPPVRKDGTWRETFWTFARPLVDEFVQFLHDEAAQHYVSKIKNDNGETRYVTRIDIVLKTDPFEPESVATLKLIEMCLSSEMERHRFIETEVRSEIYGITSSMRDLADVTESDRYRVNMLVTLSIFIILLVLVRKLWLAAYLLVTVLASYYAALGATVLAGTLWTGAVLPSVDWRVPFFLFTILVAVGEDYNILLITRALQERKLYGNIEGMRRALSRTGGAITSCGIIMAGTFATLMLAGLNTMLQVGFALAFGVLVDTFIVRPFLVPTFCMLVWKMGSPEKPAKDAAPRLQIVEQAEEIERLFPAAKKAA